MASEPTRYFDYESVARGASVPPQQIEEVRLVLQADVPDDLMMLELRLLRFFMAVRDGHTSVDQFLAERSRASIPARHGPRRRRRDVAWTGGSRGSHRRLEEVPCI